MLVDGRLAVLLAVLFAVVLDCNNHAEFVVDRARLFPVALVQADVDLPVQDSAPWQHVVEETFLSFVVSEV